MDPRPPSSQRHFETDKIAPARAPFHDDERSRTYRAKDELAVVSETHQRLHRILTDTSGSFGREIWTLDLGCGTGRYFHRLQRVRRLLALDISFPMRLFLPVNDIAPGVTEAGLRQVMEQSPFSRYEIVRHASAPFFECTASKDLQTELAAGDTREPMGCPKPGGPFART